MFRSVIWPEPSILTTYWSCRRTSTILPVLSHLLGWCPVWFCMRTKSPTARGGSCLVCSVQVSAMRTWHFQRASSLALYQVWCGLYFPGIIGMKSRIRWPKTHIAGEIFVTGSGVLRYCSTALCTASVGSSPFGPVLLVISCFIVFMPHLCRNDLVSWR